MDVAAVALALSGAAILVGSLAGARYPEIHPLERSVFHAVNRLPDALYVPLWVPMQLGNLVVGTGVGLAAAGWYRSWPMAASVVAAMLLKLLAERWLRARVAAFAEVRQRPGTSQLDAILRGDVPVAGPSFPSGHVLLVAAVACIVARQLPGAWAIVPYVLAVAVAIGRVYVGAHNPLDVTAGLGTGLLLGGLLLQFVR